MSLSIAVEAVRALHQAVPRRVGRLLAVEMVCRECGKPSPCPTRQAVDA